MNMQRKFLLFFTILLSINCFAQNYWRIQNENGEELLLTMQIDQEKHTFEAHSRKEALKEMASSFTYTLAKTAGRLHFPEIVHCEGKIAASADTILYDGTFEYLDKSFVLKAKSWQNSLSGTLLDARNRIHPISGEKLSSDKPLKDYASLVDLALTLTEKYYWDATLAKSSEWLTFKDKVHDIHAKISDDYELAAILWWYSKKLSATPYEIRRISPRENEPRTERQYAAREVQPRFALLDLSDLPVSKTEMDQLFSDIQKKDFSTLILDARGRKNLHLNAAALLADHLTAKSADWGFYLTRRWFDNNRSTPKYLECTKILKNAALTSEMPSNYFTESGRYLKPDPAQTVFKGKIFLLTDQRTSRIAEALAIWLKNDKLATIVGMKTSGQPLLFETIQIDKHYRINIPTGQFFDKEGKCWSGTGMDPDILVEGDALEKVLKL